MRRFVIFSLSIALLLTWGGAALGAGRFGATDLMYVPTSGTLSEGAFGLYANSDGDLTMLGLDYGLIPDLEGGLSVLIAPWGQTASLRLKYHLLTEKRDGLGLAIGVQDIGQGYVTPYVVAGKTLLPGLQGYLGVGGGFLDGIFFGLSAKLRSAHGAQLFLEYDSVELNLGARLNLSENIGLDLALADLDRLVIGASYVSRF